MLELLGQVWSDIVGKGKDDKSRFRVINWWCLAALIVIIVAIIVMALNSSTHYETYRAWYYIAAAIIFFVTFTGPVFRVSRDTRDKGVVTVIFWGIIGLMVLLWAFVASFAAFTLSNTPSAIAAASNTADNSYDRLLNIVPALITIWAAGLGCYINHQITMKAHRTTHAFNLIMQTRTNSEYIRSLRAFQTLYPPRVKISESDARLYIAETITKIPEFERIRDGESVDKEEKRVALEYIQKMEAIHAGKYLLNYYEFMARAIQGGDLDEGILYDTIGSTVIGVFKRCACLKDCSRESQPLVMQFLEPLVSDWEKRKKRDSSSL